MSKKLSQQALKVKLNPLQYKVTQQGYTEDPFKNEYYQCDKEGTYLCVVCSAPLFTSAMKFDSGSGWPSFFNQVQTAKILKQVDSDGFMTAVELRCGECDSHLGHLFSDGPQQKGGNRYCVNSSSLHLQEGMDTK